MTTKCLISPARSMGLFLRLAVICLTLTACHQLSDGEEKIVGMWEFTGIDATGRVVYRRDHTVVELFREYDALNAKWVPRSWGSWRLEGSEIVSEIQAFPIPKMPRIPARITRTPIREFHEDRLVREEGRSDFVRIKGGAQIYAEVLALIYVTGSFVGLLAAIRGIRRSCFRKEFILLALAGVFAVVWSTSTLLAELAQTGTVIISPTSLRSIRLPTEILGVICILTLAIGFVRLALAATARAPVKQTSLER